ncbi:MAG: biopolymer transporter ExbD [Bacteroidetes bacterium HGW-Bacteroidetes-21]|jgi:biopolymer transport protein ExbD|nr:MAG: biopolymer transporter ExbD [Bacteroidetes bacterium HGW-Bacteroidetes-21]
MSRRSKSVPEVNAGSMADIAFLLLIFFLVATTMDVDTGLGRMLPPWMPDPIDNQDDKIKERNIFVVLINSQDRLLVENEWGDVRTLKKRAKEFIANPGNKENLPEKNMEEVPYFGQYPVSKQIISLQNDRSTSYNMYTIVQNELVAAYNELREELAMQKFGMPFDKLPEDQKKAVQTIYPQRISEAEPKNIGGNK